MAGRNDKPIRASQVEMTELVLPNDCNQLGSLLGGRLMHWIDIAGAIAGQRHCHRVVVTASVDELNFLHPIRLGEVVLLQASVNRVFRTSLEVGVKVTAENHITGDSKHANTAYLTFVAVDEMGKPVPCPPIIPETEEEKRRFDQALIRREQRLKHRKNRREV